MAEVAGKRVSVHNLHVFRNFEQDAELNTQETWLSTVAAHLEDRGLHVTITEDLSATGDAVLSIRTGTKSQRLRATFRSRASPPVVAALAPARTKHQVLLIVEHLSPANIEACRRLGLACADLDGNMYLHLGATHVEVAGRPRKQSGSHMSSSPLMTRSGVQLVFVLLADPTMVDLPMRALAEASGTALGSVSVAFRELSAQHYVSTRDDERRRLHRTGHLLDRWVEGYRLRLFPRLTVGSYATDAGRWWTSADTALRRVGAQWGGETAAWHADRRLLPAQGVIYATALPTRLLAKFRMRKADMAAANVVVRRRFWNVSAWEEAITVPAPLVYADLLASDDPRQIEAAVQLRMTDEVLRRLD